MRTERTWQPHVILVHRYFAPDTPPYASILRDIAVHLGQNSYAVTVLTCQPSYRPGASGRAPSQETIAPNVQVRRWPVLRDRRSSLAKIINLVVFAVRVVIVIGRARQVDLVMAASTPPVLLAGAASVAARAKNADFLYHKQDIYPEIVEAEKGAVSAAHRVLRRIDAHTDSRAAAVVVLSEDMEHTVRSRASRRSGGEPPRIAVINNFDPWALPHQEWSATKVAGSGSSGLRMVYAGNVGRFQNVPAIAEAMLELRGRLDVTLDVIGEGPLKAWLSDFVAEHHLDTVRLHGYTEPAELADRLRSDYDLGIVSLGPGVIRAAYPSKTLSYLRNGLPVLAVVEADSHLARNLRAHGAGQSADPAHRGAISAAIRELATDQDMLLNGRVKAEAMYKGLFDKQQQLSRWLTLFDGVLGRFALSETSPGRRS